MNLKVLGNNHNSEKPATTRSLFSFSGETKRLRQTVSANIKKLDQELKRKMSHNRSSSDELLALPTSPPEPEPPQTIPAGSIAQPDKPPRLRHRKSKLRSSSFWSNLLSTSYKSKWHDFRKLFGRGVPDCDRLIVDYSCALNRGPLLQGRLFVSAHCLAFNSNIIGVYERSLVSLQRWVFRLAKKLIPPFPLRRSSNTVT